MEGGWGGHPQEAALFLEQRFKETQDAKLSPNHCGRCRCHCHSLAHSWEGRGRNMWAKGPAPHPGLQGPSLVASADPHPPQSLQLLEVSRTSPLLVLMCPGCPFWAFSTLSLAQMAPPPGSHPRPPRGSDAHSAHTASLGFPHRSPDFLDSPPSDWV